MRSLPFRTGDVDATHLLSKFKISETKFERGLIHRDHLGQLILGLGDWNRLASRSDS